MPTPQFSILASVSGCPAPLFESTLASIRDQSFEGWELCLIDDGSIQPQANEALDRAAKDDPRIRVLRKAERCGTATAANEALDMARGDFVASLDQGVELYPDALQLIRDEIRSMPEADFVYSDEEQIFEGGRRQALFKPDWAPERLRSHMYIGRLAVQRRSLVEEVGGFNADLEGALDWDLALRATERATAVLHIPKVLYRQRMKVPGDDNWDRSLRQSSDAGRRAVEAHCRRIGLPARVDVADFDPGVCHLRPVIEARPKVSIVIPTGGQCREIRGKPTCLVAHCVRSIVSVSTYDAYEVVCVADASVEPAILDELRAIAGERLRIARYDGPFNFSAKINLGVNYSSGEHLLLLNDDMEIVTPEWMERLVMYSSQAGIGGVGAQLRWEDDRVQHAGVVFENGLPGHVYRGCEAELKGYAENVRIAQNYSAVTGACLMTSRDVFKEVGGFAEELPINYNDMDYCMKVRASGRRIVYDADTLLYHFESSSRSTKVRKWEAGLFLDRWRSLVDPDPYSNPSLHFGQPRIGPLRRVVRGARQRLLR